jgi:hypothetical protein
MARNYGTHLRRKKTFEEIKKAGIQATPAFGRQMAIIISPVR